MKTSIKSILITAPGIAVIIASFFPRGEWFWDFAFLMAVLTYALAWIPTTNSKPS